MEWEAWGAHVDFKGGIFGQTKKKEKKKREILPSCALSPLSTTQTINNKKEMRQK